MLREHIRGIDVVLYTTPTSPTTWVLTIFGLSHSSVQTGFLSTPTM